MTAKSVTGKFYERSGHTVSEWADRVYLYAEKHYNRGGGDVICECWTPAEIDEDIPDMQMLKDLMSIWADQQADARHHRREGGGYE